MASMRSYRTSAASGPTGEGERAQASAQVAPLAIHKTHSRHPSAASQPTGKRPPSSRSGRTGSMHSHAQLSPPLTPRGSNEALPAAPTEPQTCFHPYLRAFYHFHPSTTVTSQTDESSITVPINSGDVILVHSIHPNGWADGTLLESGARGWLPTNYCNPYDHDAIRSLLSGLTHLWDLARAGEGEQGDLIAFTRQDYVRGMIAGVRYLLDESQCLNRDTPIVSSHHGLRRMRKGLLGELSGFVKIAKKLQVDMQSPVAAERIFALLDELIMKAFRVVTKAVRFLDIWMQDIDQTFALEYHDGRPLTPPTDLGAADQSASSHSQDDASSAAAPPEPQPASTSAEPDEHDEAADVVSPTMQPGLAVTTQIASRPTSRFSVASHRVSYTGNPSRRQNLASERLTAAQDAFLGCIGSFIGGHLQSRSPSELLSTTQQSSEAGRGLLAIVEEVWTRDGQRSEPLAEAREAMYEKLSDLVSAAKAIFVPSEGAPGDEIFMPDQGKQLVSAATSCVRAAGDCVTRSRFVIERIGDFEFEHVGLGLSENLFQDIQSAIDTFEQEVHHPAPPPEDVNKALPPQPQAPPPPPPPADTKPQPAAKPLPEPPLPSPPPHLETLIVESPTASSFRDSLSSYAQPSLPTPQLPNPDFTPPSPSDPESKLFPRGPRIDSGNADATSSSTYPNSIRDGGSVVSHPSTRATTPERSPVATGAHSATLTSFGSSSELRSNVGDDHDCVEEEILAKTYANELVYNKDGQITGGSLPALIEKLTTHEATPDAMFVTTFYLTFRLFTTAVEFAQGLVDRFEYIGDSKEVGTPVRLRVYNVFKGWLESHWKCESDDPAMPIIINFGNGRLRQALPAAGKRLVDLTAKVAENRGAAVPKLVSSIGKTSTSLTPFSAFEKDVPNPAITKSQVHILKNSLNGGVPASILDFDALELARQFTLIESKLFCSIQPGELLGSEWTKKRNCKAVNVRAMSTLSTDLANLVADTILQLEEPKKRAAIIKQWVKIAAKCLELANYDSLMAIICSLNSSMVLRLKRTWECVSQKTKTKLEELKSITDVSRNYAVLRARLQNHVAPCIPFVGIYLTDLTFVDVGNQTTRQLPGDGSCSGGSVINFDKHMRTAKIIGQLQGFQVPYRLAPVPEMQEWMESQIQRVRQSDNANVQSYYRRSLMLEPREPHPTKPSPALEQGSNPSTTPKESQKDKFLGTFHFTSSSNKEKVTSN